MVNNWKDEAKKILPQQLDMDVFVNLLKLEISSQKVHFTEQIICSYIETSIHHINIVDSQIVNVTTMSTDSFVRVLFHAIHQLKTSSTMLGLINTPFCCQRILTILKRREIQINEFPYTTELSNLLTELKSTYKTDINILNEAKAQIQYLLTLIA